MRFGAAFWVQRTTWRSAGDGNRFGSAEQTELDEHAELVGDAPMLVVRLADNVDPERHA